jgi:hypothetical protein
MKKLLVAAIVVLMASPAFAAIQNVKVSGDITSTWLDRQSFDFGATYGNGYPVGLKDQNVFITQTRLRVDADLSDNVSTTVGLINERAWNAEANDNSDTNVQLYLASVTLRELLYSPLTVTVGRQVFYYGNGLIMGNGPNNVAAGNLGRIAADLTMRTAEDGIKAVLDYKPLTIDMFYFKAAQLRGSIDGWVNRNGESTSSDVFGINGNYQLSDSWNTVVEGYLFGRINGSSYVLDTTDAYRGNKGNTLFVPGLRASTNPVKGLNVQGELAWQLGQQNVADVGNESERRDAMAVQVMASYALPVLQKYKPTVNVSYTYVSGDKNSGDNYGGDPVKSAKVYTAWDPMFESQGQGTIYNTIFNLTNMNILALGASVEPLEDVTTSFTWSNLWAAQKDSDMMVVQPNGYSTSVDELNVTGKKGIGNEYDVNVNYAYTEDVSFGLSLGWLVPGNIIESANKDAASQIIASLGVKF